MLYLIEKLYYQCRISRHKHHCHIQMDNFRPRHYTDPRCYSYHTVVYTSHHKHQRYIQMDNFRPRDDTVPRCYSYHKTLYTLHHTHQHYIQIDNVRLRDGIVPRCYSYHMSVDIANRMCYPHILKTGGGDNYSILQDRLSWELNTKPNTVCSITAICSTI